MGAELKHAITQEECRSRKASTKARHKKETFRKRKLGQIAKDKYRSECTVKTRKGKPLKEIQLSRNLKKFVLEAETEIEGSTGWIFSRREGYCQTMLGKSKLLMSSLINIH